MSDPLLINAEGMQSCTGGLDLFIGGFYVLLAHMKEKEWKERAFYDHLVG